MASCGGAEDGARVDIDNLDFGSVKILSKVLEQAGEARLGRRVGALQRCWVRVRHEGRNVEDSLGRSVSFTCGKFGRYLVVT